MKYLITSLPYPYYKTENQEDEMLSSGYAKSWLQNHHFKVRHWTQCLKITKKSHLTLRAERATFTLWVHKSSFKMPKWFILTIFWKPVFCGQTVLPDRSLLIGQKLMENANVEFKCIWVSQILHIITRFARNYRWDFFLIFQP